MGSMRPPVSVVVPSPPVASRMGRDPRLAPPASMLHVHEHVQVAWTCPLRACASHPLARALTTGRLSYGGLLGVSAFPPPFCFD